MRIDIVSLFPDMINEGAAHGIQGRAIKRGLLELVTWNPRDFTQDKHGSVDDRPYGGGPGMVMQVQPVCAAIKAARADAETARVIYLSPQGQRLTQAKVVELAGLDRIVFVAGRYEGLDERIIDMEVDEEISIGDYVLSGGELPVLVLMDAITRLLPGALGDENSADEDSFMEGLLDYPHYTRPEEIDEQRVPDVLLSGNHADIQRWRQKQALGRTWQRRPDMIEAMQLDETQQMLLNEFINETG